MFIISKKQCDWQQHHDLGSFYVREKKKKPKLTKNIFFFFGGKRFLGMILESIWFRQEIVDVNLSMTQWQQ